MSKPPNALILLIVGMMGLALMDMPYGYYQLLRITTFVTAGWTALYFFKVERQAAAVGFGLIALIYNPIFRISLDRSVWEPINILTAIAFVFAWVGLRKGTLPEEGARRTEID